MNQSHVASARHLLELLATNTELPVGVDKEILRSQLELFKSTIKPTSNPLIYCCFDYEGHHGDFSADDKVLLSTFLSAVVTGFRRTFNGVLGKNTEVDMNIRDIYDYKVETCPGEHSLSEMYSIGLNNYGYSPYGYEIERRVTEAILDYMESLPPRPPEKFEHGGELYREFLDKTLEFLVNCLRTNNPTIELTAKIPNSSKVISFRVPLSEYIVLCQRKYVVYQWRDEEIRLAITEMTAQPSNFPPQRDGLYETSSMAEEFATAASIIADELRKYPIDSAQQFWDHHWPEIKAKYHL